MSERVKIVSDMDGVLALSQEPIIDKVQERLNITFPYAKWTDHDLLFNTAITLSGDSPAAVAAWLFSNEVMEKAPPIPGSQDAMKVIEKIAKVSVATGRPGDQQNMTERWTRKHFPQVDSVYLRDAKTTEKGNGFKGRKLKELQARMYLEDDDRMVAEVLRLIQQGLLPHLQRILLLDRPWNQNLHAQAPVYRVGDWKDGDFGWSDVVQHVFEVARTK